MTISPEVHDHSSYYPIRCPGIINTQEDRAEAYLFNERFHLNIN